MFPTPLSFRQYAKVGLQQNNVFWGYSSFVAANAIADDVAFIDINHFNLYRLNSASANIIV